MNRVIALIDKCAEKAGSRAELARRLRISPQALHRFRNGGTPCPAPILAQLCEMDQLSGDEARELLALVEIENPKHAGTAALMRRAFFTAWALGAVVSPQQNGALETDAQPTNESTVYTLWQALKARFTGAKVAQPVRPSDRPYRASPKDRRRLGRAAPAT